MTLVKLEIKEELVYHHKANLRPNQNCSKPGKYTTTHIRTLRRLIEEVKKKRNKKSNNPIC